MGCHQEHSMLQTCPVCGFDPFVRNHYFTGKMMGAAEFATETLYHADKMRHHNLRLHGTGTVCGLKVVPHPSVDCRTRYVMVEPGSALDCCGREILVTEPEHPYVAAWWPAGHVIGYEHGFTHQVVDLVTDIAAGADPSPSFADGLQVQRVLAAVEASSLSSSWHDIPA